jgi:PPOX class probable F420-dependent enzyme
MDAQAVRTRFDAARVAHLATASAQARPHLVPITFARLDDATLVTAIDHKPKRTNALRRLANVSVNPAVAVLVDHYSDDWAELWWARADGRAAVVYRDVDSARDADAMHRQVDSARHTAAVRALSGRYEQYRQRPPVGPVIFVAVARWSGWAADAGAG